MNLQEGYEFVRVGNISNRHFMIDGIRVQGTRYTILSPTIDIGLGEIERVATSKSVPRNAIIEYEAKWIEQDEAYLITCCLP